MPIAFVAGFAHETNTFLPTQTALSDFEGRTSYGRLLRDHELYDSSIGQFPVTGIISKFQKSGWEIIPGLWAIAEPGGIVTTEAFEVLAEEIIERLRAAWPVDVVCLDFHGAMVAEGIDDAEGELLSRLRAVTGGDVPIVAALDLHGNISTHSVDVASALVAYRRYPHTDMRLTGERAAGLAIRLHDLKSPFYKLHRRLPFLMPIHRQTTFTDPCRALYGLLEELEAVEGIDSLSFLPGFPLADIAEAGPTILGFGTDSAAVERAVNTLYQAVLEREQEFDVKLFSAAEGVARALASSADARVLIADVQDNAGGGGTSDTVWVLEELVRQNAPDAILGLMHDPLAAAAAHEAGVGARLKLDLGGRGMPGHYPFTACFEVEGLRDEPVVLSGPMSKGLKMELGKVALLRIGGIRVVVSSVRTQCYDTEYFRHVGIDPAAHDIIVVKSTGHYRADFESLVSEIIEVEADGACRMNPAKLEYRKLPKGTRLYGAGPMFR